MTENEIAKIVVDVAISDSYAVWAGLLESAYQALMVYRCASAACRVEPRHAHHHCTTKAS